MDFMVFMESKAGGEAIDVLWRGTRFEWLRKLPAKRKGELGELLVAAIFNGRIVSGVRYDVEAGEMKIEVKLATQSVVKIVTRKFTWNQVRHSDSSTHHCLIAVYPANIRAFNIPTEIIRLNISRQHGEGDGSFNATNLDYHKVYTGEKWVYMKDFEIINSAQQVPKREPPQVSVPDPTDADP